MDIDFIKSNMSRVEEIEDKGADISDEEASILKKYADSFTKGTKFDKLTLDIDDGVWRTYTGLPNDYSIMFEYGPSRGSDVLFTVFTNNPNNGNIPDELKDEAHVVQDCISVKIDDLSDELINKIYDLAEEVAINKDILAIKDKKLDKADIEIDYYGVYENN